MPLHKTKAVVLRALSYGETDRIVTLYSQEFGKIKGIAKGAKRSQKRFGNSLEIGSCVLVSFFEKETADLARLSHCDLIRPFTGLRGDIKRLAWASYLIELVEAMTADRIQNQDLFRLLLFFLDIIDKEALREEWLRVFEVRLFSLVGYEPQLGLCRRCQKRLTEETTFFDAREGGVLCPSCAAVKSGLLPVSLGTIKTLHLAQTLPMEKLGRISFSAKSVQESEVVLSHFIRQYIGKELKSKKFISEISGIAPL